MCVSVLSRSLSFSLSLFSSLSLSLSLSLGEVTEPLETASTAIGNLSAALSSDTAAPLCATARRTHTAPLQPYRSYWWVVS